MTRVSVIMPVFNAEKTLAQAVESILAQTFRDFELIAVDDGSLDESARILQRYARLDPRVRPVLRPHTGIVGALNAGLSRARGKYIARMDADDFSLAPRLSAQKAFLDENPDVGLVACKVGFFGDPKARRGYHTYVAWTNSLCTAEEIRLHRFVESPLAHPSVMFRKTLITELGPYRQGEFPEDYELWLRFLDHGVRMHKIDRTLLHWRDDPGRLSRTSERYSLEAFYRLKAGHLARWLERNNPHHPEVVLWGSGRTTRKRAELLQEHGIRFRAYVDVDLKKIGHIIHNVPVLSPDQIPPPGKCFILPYVAKRGARQDIVSMLDELGYRMERDYILGA
ncbi:MAG: glycosyltransferase [Desulfovibrionales bacterium]